jgi:hypothetical protein
MTALLDRLRRIPSLVSVILTAGALIVVFFLFFPDNVLLIAEGVAGIIAWLVGLMFGGWWLCIRFLLALVSALLLLATWCALRAWLQVRWTKHDAVWQFAGVPHIVLSSTIAVLLAVINEIILSLFLLLSLALIIGAVARVLLSDQWSVLIEAFGNILTDLVDSRWLSTSDLASMVNNISGHGALIMRALAERVRPGAALAGGTLTTAASLLLFLVRRRKTNIDAARIVAAEIETACRNSLQTVPQALLNASALLDLPRGQLLIAVGSDRELLLLDPSAGHAARLPACLLESVVEYFHADLALTQAYSSFGSVAYAKATRARRERHLRGFEAIWRNLYQTAAFTVLFRMALYARLRAWAI